MIAPNDSNRVLKFRRPRFLLGGLFATPGAADALAKAGENEMYFFERHCGGDWGEVSPEDAEANEKAIDEGNRILSAYTLRDGTTKIWVITEANRAATTILLPDEY